MNTIMIERRQARLLVIDDDPAVRSVLRDLLSGLGYAVDDAPCGAEGLALFGQGGYDLVLTDLAMPGMSGWEVAEAVQSMSDATPVILVTSAAARVRGQRILHHRPYGRPDARAAVSAPGGPSPR